MSTAELLTELAGDISDSYAAVGTKGGTVPQSKNTNNLATAIGTIPTGITPTGSVSITANGTYDVTDKASAVVNVPDDDTELVALIEGTLTSINNQSVTNLRARLFQGSAAIVKTVFPSCSLVRSDCFTNCSNFKLFETRAQCTFNAWCFSYATSFDSLVLKSASLCTLSHINALIGTPFSRSEGGTVYVPYALVSEYENATNWSSLENATFASIQENLAALNTLGVDINYYCEIVTALPTTDIATDKVYLIETATAGTYEQWFYGSGSWVQLANITLGGAQ